MNIRLALPLALLSCVFASNAFAQSIGKWTINNNSSVSLNSPKVVSIPKCLSLNGINILNKGSRVDMQIEKNPGVDCGIERSYITLRYNYMSNGNSSTCEFVVSLNDTFSSVISSASGNQFCSGKDINLEASQQGMTIVYMLSNK